MPQNTDNQYNYQSFQKVARFSKEDFYKQAFVEDCNTIRIKKEKVAVKNLEKIFEATFRICTRKGFQGMTMRDLSTESGLSMGALYSYFATKEELLNTLQRVGNSFITRVMEECVAELTEPLAKLRTILRTHLFLSEMIQPWFFFSYMEAKNLAKKERENYIKAELSTEKVITDILVEAEKENLLRTRNHQIAASIIKAMLQDWYLKRGKYAKRGITVDKYADIVIEWVEVYYLQTD
ncbi:MAG: TetR/AcrR family transcriptional regulator [Deltaproteobacteria bacterium]|nr:TetR/AcrR family transcriptional regulator [Deltaproteobacteria bacterium]MBT4090819.1 TetR/AcrR family transcriptional regulator [Deltaproteobacteria bacterium]MBT4642332.1 TetR/AcrR family transcriptional regulator [Deltaproteobacteria bacterium]MBT6500543.1 TetR/AcrR family transcriptional regulator [Deltaproteobacteria bacterium]MBT7710177.1 TetR/AcrR family transcriptional regulator [Deltaproteobacteria bacterium]